MREAGPEAVEEEPSEHLHLRPGSLVTLDLGLCGDRTDLQGRTCPVCLTGGWVVDVVWVGPSHRILRWM